MALKGSREILATEVGLFLNEVAERGVVVSYSTAGSGVNIDSTSNVATVAASASGSKPVGILIDDFVNLDLSKQPVNWYKHQANSGDKASIVTKGWVVTNKVVGSPNAGDNAVLIANGNVSGVTLGSTWNVTANPLVGRFRSKKDEDGYARVYIDL